MKHMTKYADKGRMQIVVHTDKLVAHAGVAARRGTGLIHIPILRSRGGTSRESGSRASTEIGRVRAEVVVPACGSSRGRCTAHHRRPSIEVATYDKWLHVRTARM